MGKRDFTNLDPTVSRTRLRRRRLVTMERLLKSITSLNSCTRRHADAKADRGRRGHLRDPRRRRALHSLDSALQGDRATLKRRTNADYEAL